eukprot:gnl/TRDRNA2_/TRDRNA2_174025_c0_seq4.p1 gnl/TRDRNA2_/TRDRNA2_174025_c0~~gnl/TRDRNA2_/TRDRNA2_174025_c0_seq4.p1  ORF type:complete len:522 (+),score=99.03 gnl/TRDRNA2_/TRDRNA2_174025_c0_seq4:229-1794(+)
MWLLLLVFSYGVSNSASRLRNHRSIVSFHGTTEIEWWPQRQSDANASLEHFLDKNFPDETTAEAPMQTKVEDKRKKEKILQEAQTRAMKEAEENRTNGTTEPEKEEAEENLPHEAPKRAMKETGEHTGPKGMKMEESDQPKKLSAGRKYLLSRQQEEAEELKSQEVSLRATTNHSMELEPPRMPIPSWSSTNEAKVYFLFLAVDKVSNMDVWNAFFELAPNDRFRAYVHCKVPASCEASIYGSKLTTVPTVPSYYCTDLVSPMNQLLLYALEDAKSRNNPMDKFVFVSDSTLPAKPFASVYKTLATRKGSDFCLFPAVEWADIPAADGGKEIAAKHHQWIVLEHAHATKSLQLWVQGYGQEFMSKYRMNTLSYRASNNSFADNRNFGCLDEFWHMLTIFGPLRTDYKGSSRYVNLADFNGGPIHISPNAGWQGMCDTFVVWEKYLHTGGRNPFLKMHSMLDHMSVPHGGNSQRPGWWDRISRNGIRAIRNSDFLFVRKFIDNPTLADGGDFQKEYSRLVFM